MLDEIHYRRERPACERRFPPPCHREPRAFDREENRDQVSDGIADHGIGHHRPVGLPLFAKIKNSANNQQIGEIGKVDKLHRIIAERRRELFEPHGRIHTRQPVVERDQLGVLPIRTDQSHQVRQLFKAKQKKKMRIPVPPKMPPPGSQRSAAFCSPYFRPLAGPTQEKQQSRHSRLRAQQSQRVFYVRCKERDQHARDGQIAERHPFESSTRRPEGGQSPPRHVLQTDHRGFRFHHRTFVPLIGTRHWPRRSRRLFTMLFCSSYTHIWLSAHFVFRCERLWPFMFFSVCQCQTGQSKRFASVAISFPGFTACARPTIESIGLSTSVF